VGKIGLFGGAVLVKTVLIPGIDPITSQRRTWWSFSIVFAGVGENVLVRVTDLLREMLESG